MKTTSTNLDFWAETWIGSVVLILLSCSFFSLFSLLRLGAWLGAAGALVWSSFRIWRAGWSAFAIPRFHGIGWGIPVLLALCLISLLAGPHCFLDTYSYRLPQMFFWLQEGHPWSVPGVDGRINQMPHVWPMLSAAFYLPLGERALALPNFIGILFLAALFRDWSSRVVGPGAKADAIALIFLSAPVFLMGASTNDNVVCCCALLALSYHFADRPKATFQTTALSAFAFALACGLKPQYLALAPVWITWFFLASSRPFRTIRTKPLLVLVPLLILCSPVPTLAVNHIYWGSFMHPHVMERREPNTNNIVTVSTEEPDASIESNEPDLSEKPRDRFYGEHSFMALGSQLFAIPFNPLHGKINRWVDGGDSFVSRQLKRNRIHIQPLVIPEVASLGFFVAFTLVLGLVLAIRYQMFRPQFVLPVLSLMWFAVVFTKGSTLGRSFSGFFLLLFPVTIPALSRLSGKFLFPYATLCLLTGVAVIVTDPSHPLLPLRLITQRLSGHPDAVAQLSSYAHYSKRHHAPRTLLAEIPRTESTIGIVIESNSPFGEIWLQRPGIRVIPYSTFPSPKRLCRDGVRFVIFKSKTKSDAQGMPRSFALVSSGLEIATSVPYISFMSRGPEIWVLLRDRDELAR